MFAGPKLVKLFVASAAEARGREHLHSALHRLPHRSAQSQGGLALCGRHRNS